jgi:aldehyde:ferredoxin oxidoreductase
MTGPLTGTPLPAASRLTACTKSPLTGMYTESSVGGFLGVALKLAGYDGLILTGKGENPRYLLIAGGEVLLKSADALWGLDTYESCDFLLREVAQEKGVRAAAAIGPAGENGVPFASVAHNKGHFLGRTGIGAVMGAKNLKGLAIAGSTAPSLHQKDAVHALAKKVRDKMKENIVLESLKAFGTNSALDLARFTGDVPIKNWRVGEWDDGLDKINGPAFDAVLTGRKTCYACPVSCKREVEVASGPYKMARGPGPEYETVASFGTLCLIDDVEALSKINESCNRLGMDTISAGGVVALLLEGLEKDMLPPALKKDLEGLEFGDAQGILDLLQKMARQEGIGRLLALGSLGFSQEMGGGLAELLTTIKGLEAPMHDPRAGHGMALAYATGYRGACHMSDLTLSLEQGSSFFPSLGLKDYYQGQESAGKAEMVIKAQDLGSIVGGAAIFCLLGGMGYSEDDVLQSLKTVTGEDFSLADLLHMGRRIWILKRSLNNLCSRGAGDDALPPKLLTPLKEGAAAGSVPDMPRLLKEFYELRRLTPEGKPEESLLNELDLGFLVPSLYGED